MENKLNPSISGTMFQPNNHNGFTINIRDTFFTTSAYPCYHRIGTNSDITIYDLQEADFLKLAQACIDVANEIRSLPIKEA